MDELVQKLEALIKKEIDSTAERIESETNVIGLEFDGETFFVSVQPA